jgi:hypothetical protein
LVFDYDVIMENQFIYVNAGDALERSVADGTVTFTLVARGLPQPTSPVGSASRLLPLMTPHSSLYASQRLTLGHSASVERLATQTALQRLLTAQPNWEQSNMQQSNIVLVALLTATHLLIQWAWVPPPCRSVRLCSCLAAEGHRSPNGCYWHSL